MAPSAIQTPPATFDPVVSKKLQSSGPVIFDPAKHIAFEAPESTFTLNDLGIKPSPISPVASTVPFRLLSHEAVLAHRQEILSKPVLDNCLHHTRPGSVQLRGMSPRYAPFIHQFWTSPQVLRILSDLAGVELVPVVDYEITHTNIQLGPGGLEAVKHIPIEPPEATPEAIESFGTKAVGSAEDKSADSKPIIEWHCDSHTFVCVVMLSDARYMTGGETLLKREDGSILPVKAPQMGSAALLQGRYISHMAIPAQNMPERITIVTSFRPKDPQLVDDSSLVNVRNKSHLTEIYYQWTTYRLRVLSERAKAVADTLEAQYAENVQKTDKDGKPGMCMTETVNVAKMEAWVQEQISYLQKTMYEMRPIGQ